MRKSAIAKIIVCSILALILTSVLAVSVAVYRGNGSVQSGKLAEFLGSDSLFRKTLEITENAIERLPQPKLHLFGCAPVITFEENGDSSVSLAGRVPNGYSEGNAVYDGTPDAVEIDWAAGRVVIAVRNDSTGISLYEYAGNLEPQWDALAPESDVPAANRMIHRFQSGTLKVEQFRRGITWPGVHNTYVKTLVVTIPVCELAKLRIDAASVDIELADLSAKQLNLDAASGSVAATGCTFERADIDAAATKGVFTRCTIGRLDLDSATGSMDFDLLNTPERVDIDAASGNYRFTLPADASFSVKVDSLSGSVNINGFTTSYANGKTVVGDGSSLFDIDSMSGSVTIDARTSASSGASF